MLASAPFAMRVTPMLEQYWSLKNEVPDALLLYRLGDFYELFYQDAETAAPLLGLVLTARHRDSDIEAPMCGVPHHALDTYIGKLIAAGLKVAIAEQVEAAAKGKTLVARRIVRVVTPGTVTDPERLDGRSANELVSFAAADGSSALAWLDLSTGDFSVSTLPAEISASELLARRAPRELVLFPSDKDRAAVLVGAGGPLVSFLAHEAPRGQKAEDLLLSHFGTASLEAFGVARSPAALDAAAALLSYARSTQRSDCRHVATLRVEPPDDGLVVDAVTAAHLEIFRSQRDGSRTGTLLDVLDRTGTAFGARQLRRFLERPLGRLAAIEDRLDGVEALASDGPRLESLARSLSGIPDLPRLLARLSVGNASPRDLLGLAQGIARAAGVSALLSDEKTADFGGGAPPPAPPGARGVGSAAAAVLRQGGEASPHGFPATLATELLSELADPAPPNAREGGIFRDGIAPELDELRRLKRESTTILGELEAGERGRRGIPTLRVKFNQVFGHVFEVPGSARARIPEEALKRQTLAQVERYATPELVALDEKLRSADARLCEEEQRLFSERVARVVAAAPELLEATGRLGRLDALVSLARVARSGRFSRPRLVDEPVLHVEGGRHPVVEALRPREAFVPNDASLSPEKRLVILTGPNMGGKSTYLRQNALIVLLAHAGSFVPADQATVGLCDRIFTRVGASDSLVRGESTFLVEMAETAHILRHATPRSLVILDEVGRGTSTFDGLSLAWAIAESLHDGQGSPGPAGPSRVLFATHYHELTELALVRPGAVNRTMSVKEWNGEVIFLRRVVDGVADRSYGVQVARLAGIPEPVLARAREILANLEQQQLDLGGRPRLARHPAEEAPPKTQLSLFAPPSELLLDMLARVDVNSLTPLAALNLVATLQDRLRGSG